MMSCVVGAEALGTIGFGLLLILAAPSCLDPRGHLVKPLGCRSEMPQRIAQVLERGAVSAVMCEMATPNILPL
jgi:hypothetical protein